MTDTEGARGYPPIPVPRGAGIDWPKGAPLTAVDDAETARAVLAARAMTSVVDPVGLRRWWISDLLNLLVMALCAWQGGKLVGVLPDVGVGAFFLLVPLVIVLNFWKSRWRSRADPLPEAIPWQPTARLRWHRDVRSHPLQVAPPPAWPPGTESLALLVAAAGATSLSPSWAVERVGLPTVVGAQWVAALQREGWLSGRPEDKEWLGFAPSHVELTDEGHERLEAEVERLRALTGM